MRTRVLGATSALVVGLGFCGVTQADLLFYDFENLNVGSIQGQDGWGIAPIGDVVVSDVVSPRNGSTRAIRFAGGTAFVPHTLETPMVGGTVTISYDFFSTNLSQGDNAVALLDFRDSNGRSPMGLYVQNGGAGPSANGYFSDGTSPQVGPNNLTRWFCQGTPCAWPENTWLRFEGAIDMNDGGHLLAAHVFELSGGSEALIGARDNSVDGNLYFATLEGSTPVLPELFSMNLMGFGMDQGTIIYLDNIAIEHLVPLPAAVWLFGSALAGLGVMRRRLS